MTNNLIILGAGGHGKVIAETAYLTNLYNEIIFLDDSYDVSNPKKSLLNFSIRGKLSEVFNPDLMNKFNSSIIAFGDASLRMLWINKLRRAGLNLSTIIHPSAQISSSAKIGFGAVFFANTVVQSDVNIGDGVILNTSSSVDHDSRISQGTHICPGARIAGKVNIGSNSWIGIGSSIKQGINIGDNVTVGAGAAVVHDIPNGITVCGVPAKEIKSNS